MLEEKTRKGETVWLSWGSCKTTAEEATFLCTVGTWGSLLFLLLTWNSLCCSPAPFVPSQCLWAFHLQYLMFPQKVDAHHLSLALLYGWHWGQQFSQKLMTPYLSLMKPNEKWCQIIRGFFSLDVFFFSVDVIKYLTAKVLNSLAEFTWTLEN